MGWNIINEQQNMYRLPDKPPEMKLNDYIVEYKRTDDSYWLACFLHNFEQKVLNGWVFKLCEKHNQHSRYQDIKQEIVQVLLEKLDSYDLAAGTTLIQFAGCVMVNAVHDYMRKNVGIYLLSDKYYQNLRKVNAIYYRDSKLSHDVRIKTVIAETDLSLKKVLGYIDDGKWFRYPESIESNISDFEHFKGTPDIYSPPEYIILRDIFMAVYLGSIENLRERDRQLFFDYLGIVNFARGWVIDKKKIRLGDIADKHHLRDEQSITNRFRKIVAELRYELEKQGW